MHRLIANGANVNTVTHRRNFTAASRHHASCNVFAHESPHFCNPKCNKQQKQTKSLMRSYPTEQQLPIAVYAILSNKCCEVLTVYLNKPLLREVKLHFPSAVLKTINKIAMLLCSLQLRNLVRRVLLRCVTKHSSQS